MFIFDFLLMQQEGWWSYEFCYQKKLRQIHVEDEKVALQVPLMGPLISRAIILQLLFHFDTFLFQLLYYLSRMSCSCMVWKGQKLGVHENFNFFNSLKIPNINLFNLLKIPN